MSRIARTTVGSSFQLAPKGALAGEAVAELREAFEEGTQAGLTRVRLDLTGCPSLDSEALEALVEAHRALARAGGGLRVERANPALQDVFRFTGLCDELEVDGLPSEPVSRAPGRIGEILRAREHVSDEQVEGAKNRADRTGERLGQVLVAEGNLAERDLLIAVADQLGLPFLWVRSGVYDPAVGQLVEREICRRLKVLPLYRLHGVLHLATADPQSIPVAETVRDLTGLEVRPVIACESEILSAIDEVGGDGVDLSEYLGDLETNIEVVEDLHLDDDVIDDMAAGSPVINLINGLVVRAVRDGASDIHIEPTRRVCRIRIRVDGMLYTIMTPPVDIHPALVSRLKVMARLDIAERRMPQDGRIQVKTQGRLVDLRFSSLPGILGEKVVLRILDKDTAILSVDGLGLSASNTEAFRKLLARSHGLILVTGPTGSGKTTTLYAALHELCSDERNLVTIEDPVEYQVDAMNQNQVREKIGLTFPVMLKHVLRQDPDVVMVGEIRERETAQIAVQAALTGHLVLSTLHTNDSLGAITRMIDMGVEPFLLSSALIGVMAQRLVRTVCPTCETSYLATPAMLEPLGIAADDKVRLVRGRGCGECYDSGYRGRMAIHEVITTDAALQRLIVSNPSRDELDAHLAGHGFASLRDDGWARAREGRTSVEEILRVIQS